MLWISVEFFSNQVQFFFNFMLMKFFKSVLFKKVLYEGFDFEIFFYCNN